MKMTPEHKAKLHAARDAARARKSAVNAEIIEEVGVTRPKLRDEIYKDTNAWKETLAADILNDHIPPPKFTEIDPRDADLEALREQVAEFESKREKASHEHKTMTGREKVNDPGQIGGAQADVRESLRELIREQMAETFPERQPVRKTERDTVRPNAVVGYDREGNPVYRKRDQTADPFAVPEDLKDPNYDLQWCRVSVLGQEDLPHQIELQEQGWRFVQADSPRWSGRMMPKGYKGNIFREGLALMERPMVLTEEAKREAANKVREQSKSQREQFGMALPHGFSADTAAARQFTFARQGKAEATSDNLRPSLDIDSH
jgi:hypothetical protein